MQICRPWLECLVFVSHSTAERPGNQERGRSLLIVTCGMHRSIFEDFTLLLMATGRDAERPGGRGTAGPLFRARVSPGGTPSFVTARGNEHPSSGTSARPGPGRLGPNDKVDCCHAFRPTHPRHMPKICGIVTPNTCAARGRGVKTSTQKDMTSIPPFGACYCRPIRERCMRVLLGTAFPLLPTIGNRMRGKLIG